MPTTRLSRRGSSRMMLRDEFRVEGILGKRFRKGHGTEYLVHWSGYPKRAATWEPATNLINCRLLLRKFAKAPEGTAVTLRPRKNIRKVLAMSQQRDENGRFGRPSPIVVAPVQLPDDVAAYPGSVAADAHAPVDDEAEVPAPPPPDAPQDQEIAMEVDGVERDNENIPVLQMLREFVGLAIYCLV